jgi:NADPH-dependent 2,4-dienoyl-CoA reductase/sulfur reductase-like enzyme/rhodanese-related sulfurtransferase
MPKRILIIGAVALGPKVACRARRLDPAADILMIDRDSTISYGGCGIPYYVGGDVSDAFGLCSTSYHAKRDPAFFKGTKRVDVRTGVEALAIDRQARTVRVRTLADGKEEDLPYDTLVLATGSRPFLPPVPGADLPGVVTIDSLNAAVAIKDRLAKGQVGSAVVVGGGAIGLEMAEAFTSLWGVQTTVVEFWDQVLPTALCPELAGILRNHLEENGVRVLSPDKVLKVLGDSEGGVTGVLTEKHGEIPCELALFATGARANSQLARDAGLAIGPHGGILVDDTLRTTDPNIFAGGDCCEVRNLVSGGWISLPLGSLANRMGRIIGTNVAGGAARFPGAVGSFCLKVFDYGAAKAGLTLPQARAAGFDPVAAMVVQSDRAHFYPEAQMMCVNLIADRRTRRVLGIEVLSKNGHGAKARADAVAAILGRGATVEDVSNLEVAYAPPFASAMDVVNAAGNALENILDGRAEVMDAGEFLRLMNETGAKVLDVRSSNYPGPYQARWGDRWLAIPQDELPQRLDEVPRDEPLLLFCNVGIRAYEAQIYLKEQGLTNTRSVQGGASIAKTLNPDLVKEEPKE